MSDGLALLVHIESENHDPLLARWLRTELLTLDVNGVVPLHDEPDHPAGPITALLVTLTPTALTPTVTKIRDWSSRHHRPVEISLDGDTLALTGTAADGEEQSVVAWLAKHAPLQATDDEQPTQSGQR